MGATFVAARRLGARCAALLCGGAAAAASGRRRLAAGAGRGGVAGAVRAAHGAEAQRLARGRAVGAARRRFGDAEVARAGDSGSGSRELAGNLDGAAPVACL
jgi:hypothetical protein